MENVNDQLFGQLVWDERAKQYTAQCEFSAGLFISVSISPDEAGLEDGLRQAQQAFRSLQQSEPAVRLEASEKLLDLHNETWNDEDPISEVTFASRIKIEGLTFSGDGSVTLFYDDGDLFWGHSILVDVDSAGVFQDAYIAG